MKILIPTTVLPTQKNIRTTIIENIVPYLEEQTNLEIIWFLIYPYRITCDNKSINILDFHDYPDAKNLLEKINPDCILISSAWDSIQYALSMASNSLNIPVFSFFVYDYETIIRQYRSSTIFTKLKKIRTFFSSTTSTLENTKNKDYRGHFFLFKYKFLIKTRSAFGTNFFNILRYLFNDFVMIFFDKYPSYNTFCDYFLLPDESWIEPLSKMGINKKKLVITGNPFWDKIYHKIINKDMTITSQKPNFQVLIVTDSLVEHGVWTTKDRDDFLLKIVLLFDNNDIPFSFKIHPSTENIHDYESLLTKLKIDTKIFQKEDLWDLTPTFDIILSYGSTTAHSEFSCGGVKMVLFNPKNDFSLMPMVNEGIQNGHIVKCNKFDDLVPSIRKLHQKNIEFSKNFIQKRNTLIFNFQGKSSKNMADTIIKFTDK